MPYSLEFKIEQEWMSFCQRRRKLHRVVTDLTTELRSWASPFLNSDRFGTLNENEPFWHTEVETSSTYTPFVKNDLGRLALLPHEVLRGVLDQVDLYTIFVRWPRDHPLHQLALAENDTIAFLQEHFPDVIRAICAIKAGLSITPDQLKKTLLDPFCENCLHLGPFIYLPTCVRSCGWCLVIHQKYRPMTRHTAATEFGLPESVLSVIPTMESQPGCYGPKAQPMMDKVELFDRETVFKAAHDFRAACIADADRRHHAQRATSCGMSLGRRRRKSSNTQDETTLEAVTPVDPQPKLPLDSIAVCYLAVVSVPYFDEQRNEKITDMDCKACYKRYLENWHERVVRYDQQRFFLRLHVEARFRDRFAPEHWQEAQREATVLDGCHAEHCLGGDRMRAPDTDLIVARHRWLAVHTVHEPPRLRQPAPSFWSTLPSAPR